jgi:hypothetical protein
MTASAYRHSIRDNKGSFAVAVDDLTPLLFYLPSSPLLLGSSSPIFLSNTCLVAERSLSPSHQCALVRHTMEKLSIPKSVTLELDRHGFEADEYGVVRWQDDSPKHPRHWPLLRKAYDSAVIVLLEFFMTLISNCGSSVANQNSEDLGLSRVAAMACFTTVYLGGQALGGLIFPPMSESFGGRTIYVTATFGFCIGCLIIGVWPVPWAIILGRFISGFFSAIPCVVALGSFENMWNMRARIWLVHLWISGAMLGLAFGPPIAIYTTTSVSGW